MIIFYSKVGCPWCDEARAYLKNKGLEYEEKEVRSNPEYMQEMIDHSGQEKAPTFVIDGVVLADASAKELDDFLATN